MEYWAEKPMEVRAMEVLGKGFDLSSDFRLKFAKGTSSNNERLVLLDETNKRDVVFPGGLTISNVPDDIRCDKGDRTRYKSDVLDFNQCLICFSMWGIWSLGLKLRNENPRASAKQFEAMRSLGDWFHDTADSKYLAFDGYFISLYYLHLTTYPLTLKDEVKKSVPPRWDPASLTRFILTYGTHIIIGMAVGGQDLICVRQTPSSPIPPAEVRKHLEDLGDYLFSDRRNPPLLQRNTRDGKEVPEVFNRILHSNRMRLTSITETSSKDGLTIICSKRGGDVFSKSHSNWLQTVPAKPEAILFKFVPITSLLTGIPGSGYLSHAINLYLRYKPSPDDLQCFLEFQVPKQWAPMFCDLPLRHQRKKASYPYLQFSCLGRKIYVSPTQVSSDQKPVVGLRLYLEGKKCNRLALHLQHLSSLPNIMTFPSADPTMCIPCQWQGSDDYKSSDQFLEPIRWKRYSKVCTSVVKHDPSWLQGDSSGVFIVTGAQLLCKGRWPKTVLHLRLLFTHLPNCTIRKTAWAAVPEASHKSSFLTNLSTTFTFTQRTITGPEKQGPAAINSGVYPDGPPVPIRSRKLLKYVDVAEVVRGPQDAPGHWLVTAAKLVTDGGKIGLHVKFALLDYGFHCA
ncbi:unnamed protein product [Dovyalis caffra]|uniref:MACPF domain-containing protein n=1 Tax=Dovyalis caffra TaxID=77055 RepID=A0AAV1SDM8_9ROSI|nr:unnamed protein product [Dovyalis caffra]